MRIVFAASEAAPFIKTGGLGDVAEALPAALSKIKGNEVILFLPYYEKIKNNPEIETEYITAFPVDLSWRKQHVGVFKYKSRKRKLSVYFIDNEFYFKRGRAYGEGDDGERFAYYSKAILETLVRLDIRPDVIHCNDWQTALIPTLLHAFYGEKLGGVKTVFTIHNIEYQGICDPYFLGDTLGLGEESRNTLTFNNCVNFMKGAILSSDAVTTVSRTYANEIRYPYYAHGLSAVIEEHAFKIGGVVNGINLVTNDPSTDPALARNYGVDDYIEGKKANKIALQRELGLDERDDVPMIGMVSRIVSHKGFELICDLIGEILKKDVQLVILGTGDKAYEDILANAQRSNKRKFSLNLTFNSALASRIYASSDIYLMPSKSEPCGLSQLIAMRYGTIPVVNATGGLKDTVIPFDGQSNGTGFNFQSFSREDLMDALNRCLDCKINTPEKWDRVVRNAFAYDSSWDKPAKEYMKIYSGLIAEKA